MNTTLATMHPHGLLRVAFALVDCFSRLDTLPGRAGGVVSRLGGNKEISDGENQNGYPFVHKSQAPGEGCRDIVAEAVMDANKERRRPRSWRSHLVRAPFSARFRNEANHVTHWQTHGN
jgi:hypothetical protein